MGTYVGGQTIWAWQETPGYGVAGLDAVANLGIGGHFCVGEDDIYIFDGSRPMPVSKDLRNLGDQMKSHRFVNRLSYICKSLMDQNWTQTPIV